MRMPLDQGPLKHPRPLAPAQPETTFQREPFGVVFKEIGPHLARFFRETLPPGRKVPFDPDFERYFAAERDGHFCVFTARENGVLVGGNSFFVGVNFFSRSLTPTATQHVLFVPPWRRGGWLGYKLIRKPEVVLAKQGVKLVIYTPASNTPIDLLLKRAGYGQVGHIFSKFLGEPDGR